MTLPHLDTLIAYTVLMLGASLIITVLTQIVSTLLGLRGTNLLWGIRILLQSIAPGLESQAEAILTNPIISGSLWSRFCGRLAHIAVVGHMVRRWTLATVIRPGEVVRMLACRAQILRNGTDDANPTIATRIEAALRITRSEDSVEARFNSAMDRVSQRFTGQMRIYTVIFSFMVAIAMQLDTFRLLEQLWTDPQTRESLVNTRAAMMKEAESVMETSGTAGHNTLPSSEPQVYTTAFERLKSKYPAQTSGMGEMPVPASYYAAQVWLARNLEANVKRLNVSDADNLSILQQYAKSVASALAEKANAIRQQIEASGLDLIPRPYHLLRFDGPRNLLGTLISAMLLSLGAPFWFNTLRSLSNLHPALADKQIA